MLHNGFGCLRMDFYISSVMHYFCVFENNFLKKIKNSNTGFDSAH